MWSGTPIFSHVRLQNLKNLHSPQTADAKGWSIMKTIPTTDRLSTVSLFLNTTSIKDRLAKIIIFFNIM